MASFKEEMAELEGMVAEWKEMIKTRPYSVTREYWQTVEKKIGEIKRVYGADPQKIEQQVIRWCSD